MPSDFLRSLRTWSAQYDARVEQMNAWLASVGGGAAVRPFAVRIVDALAQDYPQADEGTLGMLAQHWADGAGRTDGVISDDAEATRQARAAWDGDGAPERFRTGSDALLMELGDLRVGQSGIAKGVGELATIATDAKRAFEARAVVMVDHLNNGLAAAPSTFGASLLAAAASGGQAVSDIRQQIKDFVAKADSVQFVHEPSRSEVLGDYLGAQWDRLRSDPAQALLGLVDGTAVVENLAALNAIARGGTLLPNAYGVELFEGPVPPGAKAITLGHTVSFRNRADVPDIMPHEMVHVGDVEQFGSAGFYPAYGGEYAARRLFGDDHDTAYRNLTWERRAEGELVPAPLARRHLLPLLDPAGVPGAAGRGAGAVVGEKAREAAAEAREAVANSPVAAQVREAVENAPAIAERAAETAREVVETVIDPRISMPPLPSP